MLRVRETEWVLNLWTLGGLSFRELVVRTWKESWADEVFGQAARLAFYHFLALFPSLMMALLLLRRAPQTGSELFNVLKLSLESVLPPDASGMLTSVLKQMGDSAARGSVWFAVLGSLWAAVNGTWAVMSGLNEAYEVTEERPWWKVTLVAAGLTAGLAVLACTAWVALVYAGHMMGSGTAWQVIHWHLVAVVLVVAFSLYYRFGPSLSHVQWRWSTPGAVAGALMWIGTTLLFRVYISYSPGKYQQVYGSVASGAILLLWFYLTGAAILIGGEINSEIENAAAQGGHPDARRPGERRPGGRAPARKE